uniref:HD domain-containing phosphohydrolase n=1 Tax=Acetatifactor sp. TaxID=1872090 RepID=UPI004055CCD0
MIHNVPYIEVPIGAVCCYIFLMFCFFNTRKTKVVRYFQLIIFACIIWSGGAVLMRLQVNPGISFWYNISLLGLFFMPISIYYFIFSVLEIKNVMILRVSGVLTCLAIFANYLWDVILAEPQVLTDVNGEIRYTYSIVSGVYVTIALELTLCMYVLQEARRKINHERTMIKKLTPLMIGIFLVLLGNCLELIPGSTFPYSTLAGVGMAVCFSYVLFKQYMFEVSYSLAIGSTYTVAIILSLAPIVLIYCGIINTGTMPEWLLTVVLSTWSVHTMVWACKLADWFAESKSRVMKEKVKNFREETASLFSDRELYQKTRDVLKDIFRETDSCIFIYDEESNDFEPLGKECANVLSSEEKADAIGAALNYGKLNMRGEIATLKTDNKLLGFVCLKFTSREKLNYAEKECLQQLATYASISLKNIKIFKEVYDLSIHDEMTGLYNRSYWKQFKKEFLSTSEKYAFIHFDVDDFKLFNELYGGAIGDDILRWCGKIVLEIAHSETVGAFRVGSNEFLIALSNADKEKALEIAKTIQCNILREDEDKPKILQPITFSMGIAIYPDTAADFDELLNQAEKASFFAKKNGKNRVEIYELGLEGNRTGENFDKAYEQIAPTVFALMAAIDAKDSYTFKHSTQVSEYAVLLAKEIGLKKNEIQIVKEAGLLHDIGKIGIPESILMKQGKLTSEEYNIMKKHVTNSIEMIHFLPNMNYVIPAVVSHHERYDGKGYPRGIAGEEIPLLGRILAVCDSFDAMISKRSYKESMTIEYAVEELEKNRGTQFDPKLAEAFINLVKSGKLKAEDSSAIRGGLGKNYEKIETNA